MNTELLQSELDAHFAMAEAMSAKTAGIQEIADAIWKAFSDGRRLYAFGNGGSASEALHFTGELVGRYKAERGPLPAHALPADIASLTCIANDYAYDEIFSRQLSAMAQPGDIVVGFTTSGKSPNVLKAMEAARKNNALTVVFTGENGQDAAQSADFAFVSPSETTARIQEMHQLAMHLICVRIDELAMEA